MSIQYKLNFVVFLTCLLGLILASGSLLYVDRVNQKETLANELQFLTKIVTQHSASALSMGDKLTAKANLEPLLLRNSIDLTCMYGAENRLFVSVAKDDDTPICPLSLKEEGQYFNDSYLHTYHSIIVDRNVIGAVYVRMELGAFDARLRSQQATWGGILILCLCVAFLFTSRLRRQIVNAFNAMLKEIEFDKGRAIESSLQLGIVKEQAVNAIDAKSRFLVAASHDLRQPLQAACLLGDLLRNRMTLAENKEIADSLYQSLMGLTELFADLLDVSRLDAGEFDANIESIQLSLVFQSIKQEFEGRFQQDSVTFFTRCPPVLVKTDPILLQRVIKNLVVNALDHAGASKIFLLAKKCDKNIEVSIVDNGCGIPEEEFSNVFKEFYRIENLKGSRAGGIGLGLNIVKRLCVLLSHQLNFKNRVKSGTIFTITLPFNGNEQQKVAPCFTKEKNNKKVEHNVLIVDDDPIIALTMKQLLMEEGYTVETSNELDSAMALLEKGFIPDLIVSDYHFSEEYNGLDVFKGAETILHTPFEKIIVTGETDSQILFKIRELGGLVVTKPVNVPKLLMMIEGVLER